MRNTQLLLFVALVSLSWSQSIHATPSLIPQAAQKAQVKTAHRNQTPQGNQTTDQPSAGQIEEYAQLVASELYPNDESTRDKLKQFLLTGQSETPDDMVFMRDLDWLRRNTELQEPLYRLTERLILDGQFSNELVGKYFQSKLIQLYRSQPALRTEIEQTWETLLKNDLEEAEEEEQEEKNSDAEYQKQVELAKQAIADQAARQRKYANAEIQFFQPAQRLPDPQSQNSKDRTRTLLTEIESATKLIKEGNEIEFVNRYMDPTQFAQLEKTAEDTARDFLVHFDRFRGPALEELSQQTNGLVWQLGGRTAACKEQASLAWVYRQGRWYLNTLRPMGQPRTMTQGQELDFFANNSIMPRFEWEKLKTPAMKLESLRLSQQKAIQLLGSGQPLEFFENVVCPLDLAKQATAGGFELEKMIGAIATMPNSFGQRMMQDQSDSIAQQLNQQPTFRLDGRVAIFKQEDSDRRLSRRQIQWQFDEGRWRLLVN